MDMPTVLDAAAMIRRRQVSARELMQACLDAIEDRNGELNAFVHLGADHALETADAVDAAVRAGDRVGPLAGVPFGVKDLEDCRGMPTSFGSRWFHGGPPKERDDIHVARLRAAGAIPLGKTATPEFGAWAYTASPVLGVTRNPWDRARTPGGSSGGSSAAVSAAMVPFCTASDGGGSIRTPAAFTGLVGLRACYGRIPTLSVTHLSQNAVVGALTTTVGDHAILLDLMAGPDRRDRTCLPAPVVRYRDTTETLDLRGLRVAWTRDLGFATVDPEAVAVAQTAALRLADAAELSWVEPTIRYEDFIMTYARMEGADKFVGIDPMLWRDHLDQLDPRSSAGWASTARATLPKLAAVEAERRRIVQITATLFDDIDVLLMPTTATAAFEAAGPMPTMIDGMAVHGGMAAIPTMLANLVNLPAISVPAGLTTAGLPVGLQIIGDRFREDVCLRLARIAEQAMPWPRHAPTRN